MKIAGLDIGTTGCKCTVFNSNGEFLAKSYRDYPVKRDINGHEIDCNVIIKCSFEVIKEMANKYPDIEGIGVTSFGETFVCVGEDGKPLHNAMLYTDPRGKIECEKLFEKLGDKIPNITGLRPHEMYSISKIMWIKENLPEIYKKTKRIMLMEDFLIYNLTGKAQIDYSLASRTMAFDIKNLCWSKEIFSIAEIDISLMSKPVQTGTVVGEILPEVSNQVGLSLDTKVIAVSHDQIAASVGAGAFNGSLIVDGAGTVECLTPIYDELPDIETLYKGYYSVVPYVIKGKYVAYAFSYTGGALLQWCTDNLSKEEKNIAQNLGMSVNEYLEKEFLNNHGNDSIGDLLVLPHFAGAATPYMDTGSKGAIIGLTTDTTVADIYRGCMEGVAYEMYLNLQRLGLSEIGSKQIFATGGGAHSAVWMQMKSDILNMPITALKTVDAGTVGCAMITGISLNIFKDFDDASRKMVKKTVTYMPRPDMNKKYMEQFEKYKLLYNLIRPLV